MTGNATMTERARMVVIVVFLVIVIIEAFWGQNDPFLDPQESPEISIRYGCIEPN